MTASAPKNDSATNLSAFNLGVYANQFLWNLDQAVVAGSENHRIAALGLIRRLQAIGTEFTEMRTDAPLQVFLNEIREWVPDKMSQAGSEWWDGELSRGMDPGDDRSEGEWWYSHFGLDRERKRLRQAIVDATLQTAEQRLWFELGALIDSGRHRWDVGHQVCRLTPGFVGPPSPPQRLQGGEGNPNWLTTVAATPDGEQRPRLWTFVSGELPPRPEWWHELVHLCEQLHVPCSPNPPDLPTSTSIIDAVEKLIERVQIVLGASLSDANVPAAVGCAAPTGSGDGHQQSMSCPPTVETEEPPHFSDGIGALKGNSPARSGLGREPARGMADPTKPDEKQPGSTSAAAPDLSNSRPILLTASPAIVPGDADPNAHTNFASSDPEPNETIGRWKFFDAEVQFAEFNMFLVTQPYRGMLHCLLKDRIRKNWKHLAAAGWGELKTKQRHHVATVICKLREILTENIEPSFKGKFPKDPIPHKGKIDDLSYRIDDLLR